ncbi:MAG: hypothetical protein PHO83_06315 [Geobacteraceae bacterium]|nr:hypothetical protein [Geobacteraceae bacterium]
MENSQVKIKEVIWDMKTVEAVKTARLPALVFSIFGAFIWAVITISTVFGHKNIYGYSGFIYVALFATISFGLFKMRREAAIAYFIVSVVAVVFAWGNTTKQISAFAGVLVALLSVRATLCYARLCGKKEKEQAFNQEDTPDQKPVR